MSVQNSGLSTSLKTLVNTLKTSQTQLSYTSQNISNVNTEGYTKRVVSQQTSYSDGEGIGTSISTVRRSIDDFLLKSLRAQLSTMSQSTTTNDYMSRLQQVGFGDPNSSFTVTNTLNDMFNRLSSFAADTSSASQRTLVINSAVSFTNTMNTLATNIEQERFNADTDISQNITDLNGIIKNLSAINSAIKQTASVGGDVNSLYDARDLQLNNMKKIINADFTFTDDGEVSVSLSNTELLGFGTTYQLSYTKANSVSSFVNNIPTGAITVTALAADGSLTNNTTTLLSASNDSNKIDDVPTGSLRSLIDLRDKTLPSMLSQLDNLAYTFGNQFNEVHNSGTGYPPAQTITGTTKLSLDDTFNFSGKAMIAVTDDKGQPVAGRYSQNLTPLVIDFDKLDGGDGVGTASVQDIINQINNYYGPQPATIANVGDANDIRLDTTSSALDTTRATGNITFSTLPANNSTITINGTTIKFVSGTPANQNEVKIGADLPTTMQNLKDALSVSTDTNVANATYSNDLDTLIITAKTGGTTGNSFSLATTGGSNGTASGANLTGGTNVSGSFSFGFDFSNLSADGSDISFDVSSIKINGGTATPVSFNSFTQAAGQRETTDDKLSVSLSGLNLQEGDSFNVTATVNVTDKNGNVKTEDVTFAVKVPAPGTDIKNTPYAATAISGTGDGTLVNASSTSSFMTASLVDANGAPITAASVDGYLKLTTNSGSSYRIAIDQLNSKEGGDINAVNPALTATNDGISHFFGLNNFFNMGSSAAGAALNISVRSDIQANPSLLSGGNLSQSISTGTGNVYTYEIGSGSNQTALNLAQLQNISLNFDASGGLPALNTSVNQFAAEVYSYAANLANQAAADESQNSTLTDALQSKFSDISGVNIDEELGNTIQIQNTYAAAAKVLSIVRDMFTQLENTLQ